ncbi:diguanylate cyclase domain-containing protein [Deinococcus sp.]|uniref:sensor domain-containing diguanylate cyclase n=1 Tax=Deinococcus sp. TaxID=47478 RepID=UPI002869B638|nr:diguanylate cyclase [Deinococcus sp.]
MSRATKPTSPPGALTPTQATRATFWARLLMLLAVLVTQLLTVSVVVWNDRQNAERVLQSEASRTLDQLARVAADNVRAYLQAPTQIVSINAELIRAGQLSANDPPSLSVTFQTMLNAMPQLNGVLIGHDDGRFTFARRAGAGDTGRYLRSIEVQPQRRVTTSILDATGRVISQSGKDDPYDPRTRPWYTLALARPDTTIWTAPYIFASSGQPGVTVARALPDTSGGTIVLGANVQLRQLASYLQSVQISANGGAFLTDDLGHVVATSRAWPGSVGGHLPTLKEIADPALQTLLGASSHVTPGTQGYTVNGQQYASVVRPVQLTPGVQWMVGVYAPVSDFTAGLQRTDYRLATILLACVLGSLLAWPLLERAVKPMRALHQQATTDPLTGLHNRGSFLAQLDEVLDRALTTTQTGRQLGVAILDLDGFKEINDTYGHPAGDEVLLAVGARLLAALRPGDILGRLGGDEFALLVDGASREEVQLRVEGMIAALARRPVTVDQFEHPVRATAGLAFYDPAVPQITPLRRTAVMARADTALIRGKRRVKGRVWVDGESTLPDLLL